MPDNIEARPALLWERDGVVAAAVNPGPGTLFREGSVAVGHLYDPHERWWEPGSPVPDGAYALCRVAERRIELLTDLYASRTLWYAMTDSLFLASSSQRALVALLGGFELNHEAVSWMLSSGYLPPGAGWDVRLRRVPPACRLTLDRRRWTLDASASRHPRRAGRGHRGGAHRAPARRHPGRLRPSRGAVGDLAPGALGRHGQPQHPRRGLCAPANDRPASPGVARRPGAIAKNDAAIGERVADHFGLPHSFYPTDFTGEPLDRVLERFLAVSEGQLDHFEAYTDGLHMWKLLFESGVEGVIRGDEPTQGYQWHYPSEELSRLRAQAQMVADYPPTHAIHRLGLAPQTWPENLRRRTGRSRARPTADGSSRSSGRRRWPRRSTT